MEMLAFGPVLRAADLVHDAALGLAGDASDSDDAARYLDVAARLGTALDLRPTRAQVLAASPRVVEASGRVRTLVEMIEQDAEDGVCRLRLATLLLRALIWQPADRAVPTSARALGLSRRTLIRYRAELIRRRLAELRRARGSATGP